MRMWNVDVTKMCLKHLLGEHVEMHMFAGTIKAGKSIQGFIRSGLVETGYINTRHDELAREIQRRGYTHKSPLQPITMVHRGHVDIKNNEKELHRRCIRCQF